ncbi:MAG: zf-HC2 domain-containing protein [Bacteroidota bacterium]
MDCKNIRQLIIDSQHQELDWSTMKSIEEHIANCEACKELSKEYYTLFDDLNQFKFELPDEDLEMGFYDMLEQEKVALKNTQSISTASKLYRLNPFLRIAAAVALIVGGYTLGYFHSQQAQRQEMTLLTQEKIQLQTLVTLSLMEDKSASKRLQAVQYAKNMEQPTMDVLKVLIAKMSHDKRVNIRLAAVNALSQFAEKKIVKQALIKALEIEQNPNMQIEIIQLLVAIQEKQSIPIIKNLLQNHQLPDYIKEQIQYELEQLI